MRPGNRRPQSLEALAWAPRNGRWHESAAQQTTAAHEKCKKQRGSAALKDSDYYKVSRRLITGARESPFLFISVRKSPDWYVAKRLNDPTCGA